MLQGIKNVMLGDDAGGYREIISCDTIGPSGFRKVQMVVVYVEVDDGVHGEWGCER